jgi:hypothetical protein
MRRTHLLALTTILAAVAACSSLRRGGTLADSPPAYRPAKSADIRGDWVLRTSPDSTAFVGARLVQLSLSDDRFTILADYPGGDRWVVTGSVQVSTDGGLVRLTPETNSRAASGAAPGTIFRPGEPLELLVGAADNSMVFAPLEGTFHRPTSVWHRREAAEAAGLVHAVSAGTVAPDSAKKKP